MKVSMTTYELAEENMKRADRLTNEGIIYAAGMLYAQAAKLYDIEDSDECAHIAEDGALWCLRELCANHLGKDNIIHEIRNLAQQIAKPGPDACRFYA